MTRIKDGVIYEWGRNPPYLNELMLDPNHQMTYGENKAVVRKTVNDPYGPLIVGNEDQQLTWHSASGTSTAFTIAFEPIDMCGLSLNLDLTLH